MFLRKRLKPELPSQAAAKPVAERSVPQTAPLSTPRVTGKLAAPFIDIKRKTHRLLIETMRQQGLDDDSGPEQIRSAIREALEQILADSARLFNRGEKDRLIEEIYYDMRGLGPLEPLLADEAISEIMVNNAHQVYIERSGKIQLSEVSFYDDRHLLQIIDRIVNRVGRRIDESSPMCDARLPDGSRINAIIPPLAIDGPALTIRKFKKDPLTISHLIGYQSLTQEMADFLKSCAAAKLNVLISGGTGSGKTTLLNILSSFIPEGERLITIEDAAELQLQQNHVIRLETRPNNTEGAGGVTQSELLKNCLRMRPDRIILGEVRGGEALAMLQAMNTGHEGSLATVHANSTRDAIARLETMVLMAGTELPLRAIRDQVRSAIDLIIQIERMSDGCRRVTSVTEIVGMEGDCWQLQDIFTFQRQGMGPDGTVLGQHRPTGLWPKCADRLAVRGLPLSPSLFQGENI